MPDPKPPVSAGEIAYELHFQNGFTGQDLRVLRGAQELAHLTAKTRMQVGMAEVVHLSLPQQDEITIQQAGADAPATVKMSADRPFVLINRVGNTLQVTQTATLPRYM